MGSFLNVLILKIHLSMQKNILSTEMVIPNLYVRSYDLKPFKTDNNSMFYKFLSGFIDNTNWYILSCF